MCSVVHPTTVDVNKVRQFDPDLVQEQEETLLDLNSPILLNKSHPKLIILLIVTRSLNPLSAQCSLILVQTLN